MIRFQSSQGDMHWHHSSPGVTRGICGHCGSSISYENTQRPGEIDITLNSLDDPTAATLRAHIWTEDKQPWLRIEDDLPVYTRTVSE